MYSVHRIYNNTISNTIYTLSRKLKQSNVKAWKALLILTMWMAFAGYSYSFTISRKFYIIKGDIHSESHDAQVTKQTELWEFAASVKCSNYAYIYTSHIGSSLAKYTCMAMVQRTERRRRLLFLYIHRFGWKNIIRY